MKTLDLVPATAIDYRRRAEKRLPRPLFDYVDGGAYDEVTMRANVDDFQRLRLRQVVMRDVSDVQTDTMLFGHKLTMPIALAPIGMGGMLARRAELQAKRAADAAGIPFILSTVSICSMEEVTAVSSIPPWFQLYMLRDRGVVKEMLERAASLGIRTLVFTVDLAVLGARYRDVRNGLNGGTGSWGRLRSGVLAHLVRPFWTWDVGLQGKPHTFGNLAGYVPKASNPADFREWVGRQLDASVTWSDIEWLRNIWDGTLIIKGVLTPEDAQAAAEAGADAVVVSNHGGRQLDGVSSGIVALPPIVDAMQERLKVLVDGGIRSGLDVVKAIAQGADGVLIGRPWAWAMGAGGEASVTALLRGMQAEMRVAMALTGRDRIAGLSREILES